MFHYSFNDFRTETKQSSHMKPTASFSCIRCLNVCSDNMIENTELRVEKGMPLPLKYPDGKGNGEFTDQSLMTERVVYCLGDERMKWDSDWTWGHSWGWRWSSWEVVGVSSINFLFSQRDHLCDASSSSTHGRRRWWARFACERDAELLLNPPPPFLFLSLLLFGSLWLFHLLSSTTKSILIIASQGDTVFSVFWVKKMQGKEDDDAFSFAFTSSSWSSRIHSFFSRLWSMLMKHHQLSL